MNLPLHKYTLFKVSRSTYFYLLIITVTFFLLPNIFKIWISLNENDGL